MSNNEKNTEKKITVRNDVFDAFRNLTTNEMDESLNDLRTDLLNLNLHDNTTPTHQPPFQNEAAALPIPITTSNDTNTTNANNIETNMMTIEPDKNTDSQNMTFYGRNNMNRTNNGTAPRTRNMITPHSDEELMSPRYTSAFARSMQYNRDSGNFNYTRNNSNFNRRPFPNQQNNTGQSSYNYNVNNSNNNPQTNQSINDILQMAVLIPNFDGTENNFENFEIACQDASKILFIKYILLNTLEINYQGQ